MAIKYEITADSSGFVTEIRKIQDTVKDTTKVVERSFDEQGKSAESLRGRLRALTQELAEATVEFRSMSEAEKQSAKGQELLHKIDKLTNQAGELRDAMDDANRSIRGVASDTKNWDALAGGINVATSAFGGLTGAASLFGAKEEELQELQTKLQASLAISNALSVIQNNLQKESALMLGIRDIREKAAATAIAIRTAAEGRGVIVTKAATAAQAAFNLVAKANPYVLLAGAILSVVGVLAALHIGQRKAKESAEALAKAEEEAAQKAKEAREAYVGASAEMMNAASRISYLQTAYKNANTEMGKTQILKEAAAQFKALGLECNNLNDAQRLLVNQGGQVIEMLRLQGEVAALSALKMEAFKRAYSTHLENGKGVQYSAQLAGLDSEVQALDQQILSKSMRLSQIKSALPMARTGSVTRTTRGGSSGGGKTMTAAERKTMTAAERKVMAERQKKDAEYAARDLELSTAEAITKAKEEGTDKIISQIWLDYNREMLAIEKTQEELRRKRIEEAKKTWDADPKNKDKDFWASAAYTLAYADTAESLRNKAESEDAALMERERRLKEVDDEANAAMREYLKAYGTYQEQRLAIEEEYQDKIDKARTEGEKLMLSKQRDEELRSVDERFGLVTQAMADLFADASKKSVKAIQAIIDKYEKLVKYMEGNKDSLAEDELSLFGLSQDDIRKILSGEISIKELTDRLKELKDVLKDKSPWINFKRNIEDAVKSLHGANGDKDKIGTAISNIGTACKEYLPELERFATGLSAIFGVDDSVARNAISAIRGLSTATTGIGQIFNGNFVDGINNAVEGMSQLVSSISALVDAFSRGRNMEYVYAQTELEAIRKSVDLIVEKMEDSSLADAVRGYNEATSRYEASVRAGQQTLDEAMGKSRSNVFHQSQNHHSAEHLMWDFGGQDDIDRINALLGTNISAWADLWFLSPDQLAEIQRELPDVFAIIYKGIESVRSANEENANNAQRALEDYMALAGKMDEIEEAFRKKMTGTSIDSIRSEFRSTLADMTDDAAKFSENFKNMLANAVINSMMSNKYNKLLEGWYENFSNAFRDDQTLSGDEAQDLQRRYEEIVNEARKERDALYKGLGIGSSSEGSAVYNASKTFTQEQGDVLNGRMTAIQMGVRQEVIMGQQIVENLKSMASIASNTQSTNAAVLDIRNMMADTNTYLRSMAAYSRDTNEKLETITQKVKEL